MDPPPLRGDPAGLIARIPVPLPAKLLPAFLVMALLLLVVCGVGIGALSAANARAERLASSFALARHGIALTLDAPSELVIDGDHRKLKQVVINLLSNAVKFTPDGGRVDVRAAVGDADVRISVQDSGVGIADEDRERIFEEFRQTRQKGERTREGTGLGLALSKRYVELHGGRLTVESAVGAGSTFTIWLPRLLQPLGGQSDTV